MLTLIGLYGVMAYSVSRRTREISVRVALGATRPMVLQMVLRQAVVLILSGSGIGITAALASGSLLQTFLYGTGARNPVVLASVSGLGGYNGNACRVPAGAKGDACGSP